MTITETQPRTALPIGTATIALSMLDIDPVNVRRTNLQPDETLVASIEADGIEQPLLVRPGADPRMFLVYDGGMRLRALRLLRERKRQAKRAVVNDQFQVPVVMRNLPDRDARKASLSLNIHRADLHPVDRYEAISEAIDNDGETVASVAVCHGMSEQAVKQALALGNIAPSIRQAWRDGIIDARAAQAFTMASSPDEQERVFKKLTKNSGGRINSALVYSELDVNDDEIGAMAAFVGAKAYAAAGGRMIQDLFSPTRVKVSSAPMLKKLADEKLAAECDRLVAEGWKWALILPSNYYGGRERVNPKFTDAEQLRLKAIDDEIERMDNDDDPRGFDYDRQAALDAEREQMHDDAAQRAVTPKFKAAHGCMVTVGDNGRLKVLIGYTEMPSAKKAGAQPMPANSPAAVAATAVAGERSNKPASLISENISTSLNQRLSEQLTMAAASIMEQSPKVALAALVAGALADPSSNEYMSRVDITVRGLRVKKGDRIRHGNFQKIFEGVLGSAMDTIVKDVARVAALALDFQENNGQSAMTRKQTALLCNTLDGRMLGPMIAKTWDAKDYFASISGKQRVLIVTEVLGDDRAREVAKMAKDAQVKWCLTNIPKTGWLPPQLRTAHYKGPKKPAKK